MEIQDLKSIWTKVVDDEHTKYQIDQKEVREMIHKKSNSILTKVERELKYKRWFSGIIGGTTVVLSPIYLFKNQDSPHLFHNIFSPLEMVSISLLLGLVLLFLCINFSLNYKKITALKITSQNLKVTLDNVNHILKKIMNLTIFFDVIIVPFIAFLVLYKLLFKEESFLFDSRVVYILLGTAITFFFIRYVSIRQQEKRFGTFIKNLETCISDIDYLEKDDA